MLKNYIVLIYAIAIFITLFSSCQNNSEDVQNNINKKICERLHKKDLKPADILNLKKEVISDFSKTKAITYNEYLSSDRTGMESCFRTLNFKKQVVNINPDGSVSGNASQYIKIANLQPSIFLDERESPSFLMKLKLNVAGRFNDSIYNSSGKLTLLDNSGRTIETYSIYMSPDLNRMLSEGTGETWVTVVLAPVWGAMSDDPFQLAAESLDKMQKAEKYDLNISLNNDIGGEIGSGSNGNIDALLKDLEIQVDNFASTIKKALSDDLYAMAKYPEIQQEAQNKLSEIKNLKTKMNTLQLKRLAAVEARFLKAEAEIK